MTREDGIGALIRTAEALNDTDPREAAALLRIADRLLSKGRPRQYGEFSSGMAAGSEDRERGVKPLASKLLASFYGLEYRRGYAEGYEGAGRVAA